ncbi:MAG: 3-isopropylmalate dehydratase [Desulfurococcales archaeon]|nr:3-isopropylmalate dehydratase [Desulfurococcales archaeon]
MGLRIRGRAWKLGNNISTDHIISGKYKFKSISSLEGMIPYVFKEVIPGFHEKVREGDVLVAGRNFGMGSSREHAPRLLKLVGVGAVVAESFARIFFRNATNIGLPVITATLVPRITEDGDIISVNLEEGVITNESKDVQERFKPYPKEILEVIRCGGIIEYIRKYGSLPW